MNGLLTVAFGAKFERMAAHTCAYSRRFTDLPITVLTNVNEESRHPKWREVDNVNFVYIKDIQSNNRQYKTSMIDYSPYDKTIYIDADAIVQQKGIEKVFDRLEGKDIMLNVYGKWVDRVPLSYYRRAMALLNVKTPITIFYGAFIGFTKSEGARRFFKAWNANWKRSNIKREMPALACTVKKMPDLKLVRTGNRDKVFTWIIRKGFIIQHEYGARFWTMFFPGYVR